MSFTSGRLRKPGVHQHRQKHDRGVVQNLARKGGPASVRTTEWKESQAACGDGKFPDRPEDLTTVIPEGQPGKPSTASLTASARAGKPGRQREEALWAKGYTQVAGVDEAGRGPLAGPVVAAACVISRHVDTELVSAIVSDSKRMGPAQRESVFMQLVTSPHVRQAISVVDSSTIDDINILQATLLAMTQAVAALPGDTPHHILIDGNSVPKGLDSNICTAVVKGDNTCTAIAAASILAKVTRDRLMVEYDRVWPVYGFKQHKGYGTAAHMAALALHGPCPVHRRTFEPIKSMLANQRMPSDCPS